MVAILEFRPEASDPLATISLEEFAGYTGLGMTAIREKARNGTLPVPCVRIGRVYRIPRRAVEAWLYGQQVTDDAA